MFIFVMFLSTAFSQVPDIYNNPAGQFVATPCLYPSEEGRLVFVSGIAGCTEKSRRKNPQGEEVTVQWNVPDINNRGKSKTISRTLKTSVKDGKLVSISSADGSDLTKSSMVRTLQFDSSSRNPQNYIDREMITVRDENAKGTTFVTYDRNLCTQLKANPHLDEALEQAQACSQSLLKIEEAISQASNNLKAENMKLGLPEGPREVVTGRVRDLMSVVSHCSSMEFAQSQQFRSSTPNSAVQNASKISQ